MSRPRLFLSFPRLTGPAFAAGPMQLEVLIYAPHYDQSGVQGRLITAVVIFTILFVVSTIFAIYFGVQMRTEDQL